MTTSTTCHGSRAGGGAPARFPMTSSALGVLMSDGTKWTNLDGHPWQADRSPDRPVVIGRGGGGGGDSFEMRYWMWPLPPEGPLMVVSEWPAYGVAETRVAVDAAELRARAAEAEAIWPE